MIEREMEDLIAKYVDEFFPRKQLTLKGRQCSFKDVGRFDLLFEDEYHTNILMELKARPAKYEDASQLAKYKDALKQKGVKNIIMWLIATQIPGAVREFLDRIGIEYTEIHEPEYCIVAERHKEKISEPIPVNDVDNSIDDEVIVSPPIKEESITKIKWKRRSFSKDLIIVDLSVLQRQSGKYQELIEALIKATGNDIDQSLIKVLKGLPKEGSFPSGERKQSRNRFDGHGYMNLYRWCVTNAPSRKKGRGPAKEIWKFLFGYLPKTLAEREGNGISVTEENWNNWYKLIS